MSKLERTFSSLQEKNPYWSSIICFANAVMGRKFVKMEIGQNFKKLVEKDDYSRSDKDALLKFLCRITLDEKVAVTSNLDQ